MDLYASDYGKRICLVCGARLGAELRHLEQPPRVEKIRVTDTYRMTDADWQAVQFSYTNDAQG